MNLGPLIDRELRVAARRSITYWERGLTALALSSIAVSFAFDTSGSDAGSTVFMATHSTLCCVLGLSGLVATFDSISKEKREGTLGLLLLAPVTAGGVVFAKAVSALARVFYLWIAAIPVLMLPLLLGGVTLLDFFSALSLQSISILTGIAAGLAASLRSVRWRAAASSAAIGGCVRILIVQLLLVVPFVPELSGDADNPSIYLMVAVFLFFGFAGDFEPWSQIFAGATFRWFPLWRGGLGLAGAFAMASVILIILGGGRRIEREVSSNDEKRPRRLLGQRWSWARSLKRLRLRKALERNPLSWLRLKDSSRWHPRLAAFGLAIIAGFFSGDALSELDLFDEVPLNWMLFGLLTLWAGYVSGAEFSDCAEGQALEAKGHTGIRPWRYLLPKMWDMHLVFLFACAGWMMGGGSVDRGEPALAMLFLPVPTVALFAAALCRRAGASAVLSCVMLVPVCFALAVMLDPLSSGPARLQGYFSRTWYLQTGLFATATGAAAALGFCWIMRKRRVCDEPLIRWKRGGEGE